jgi:hypothetical protein
MPSTATDQTIGTQRAAADEKQVMIGMARIGNMALFGGWLLVGWLIGGMLMRQARSRGSGSAAFPLL